MTRREGRAGSSRWCRWTNERRNSVQEGVDLGRELAWGRSSVEARCTMQAWCKLESRRGLEVCVRDS